MFCFICSVNPGSLLGGATSRHHYTRHSTRCCTQTKKKVSIAMTTENRKDKHFFNIYMVNECASFINLIRIYEISFDGKSNKQIKFDH